MHCFKYIYLVTFRYIYRLFSFVLYIYKIIYFRLQPIIADCNFLLLILRSHILFKEEESPVIVFFGLYGMCPMRLSIFFINTIIYNIDKHLWLNYKHTHSQRI